MKKVRVGVSAKDMFEFVRFAGLGIKLIEIKLDFFSSAKTKFITYNEDSGAVDLDHYKLGCISALAKELHIDIQFHLPAAAGPSLKNVRSFNFALRTHHDVCLKYYLLFEEIYREHGVGSVITAHLPLVRQRGGHQLNMKKSIRASRDFLLKLDAMRLAGDHQVKIGFENMGDWTDDRGILGNSNEVFEELFKDLKTFGVTFDTGHVRLCKNFSEKKFLEKFRVVNMHFHGNSGRDAEGHGDDHAEPYPENVDNYFDNLQFCAENNIPVVLELKNFESRTDDEIVHMITRVKKDALSSMSG